MRGAPSNPQMMLVCLSLTASVQPSCSLPSLHSLAHLRCFEPTFIYFVYSHRDGDFLRVDAAHDADRPSTSSRYSGRPGFVYHVFHGKRTGMRGREGLTVHKSCEGRNFGNKIVQNKLGWVFCVKTYFRRSGRFSAFAISRGGLVHCWGAGVMHPLFCQPHGEEPR